jgi:hypothetical protein
MFAWSYALFLAGLLVCDAGGIAFGNGSPEEVSLGPFSTSMWQTEWMSLTLLRDVVSTFPNAFELSVGAEW